MKASAFQAGFKGFNPLSAPVPWPISSRPPDLLLHGKHPVGLPPSAVAAVAKPGRAEKWTVVGRLFRLENAVKELYTRFSPMPKRRAKDSFFEYRITI